jgi:hypothetical protein
MRVSGAMATALPRVRYGLASAPVDYRPELGKTSGRGNYLRWGEPDVTGCANERRRFIHSRYKHPRSPTQAPNQTAIMIRRARISEGLSGDMAHMFRLERSMSKNSPPGFPSAPYETISACEFSRRYSKALPQGSAGTSPSRYGPLQPAAPGLCTKALSPSAKLGYCPQSAL